MPAAFRSAPSAPLLTAAPALLFALALLLSAPGLARAAQTDWRFSFGPDRPVPGYVQVTPATVYNATRGFGFEPGARIEGVDRGGADPLHGQFCTAAQPFYFSVRLPEGNYNVTVVLGDQDGATVTTVKAELRRLMLEKVATAPGEFATRTFTVNLRRPEIPGDGEVRLKPREKTEEWPDWDDKLTLEFNNTRPCLCALEIARADHVPTVYLAGDSTVCDQPREPWNSWGQMLTRFFGPGIAVANHAESGESARSFIAERRLAKIASLLKPGDWLFMQFGHNDQKERGPGVGAWTTYTAALEKMIAVARAHGATPVLVTPVNRRTFDAAGQITNSLGDFPDAMRRLARAQHVALIDLNAMSKTFYEALGPEQAKRAFATVGTRVDGTHHDAYGSYDLAKCIVAGIRADHLPLARYLRDDTPPFDPAYPDPIAGFDVPPSPLSSTVKPYGN